MNRIGIAVEITYQRYLPCLFTILIRILLIDANSVNPGYKVVKPLSQML
jgi:hypothetical protein